MIIIITMIIIIYSAINRITNGGGSIITLVIIIFYLGVEGNGLVQAREPINPNALRGSEELYSLFPKQQRDRVQLLFLSFQFKLLPLHHQIRNIIYLRWLYLLFILNDYLY